MIAFADGPIGYSWRFLSTGTTGVLSGTWPFLACVASCSAAGGFTPDCQGMVDVIDKHCPPGSQPTSFTFGTTSGSFTSISMEIREPADFASALQPYNASTTPNPDTLQLNLPVVGDGLELRLRRNPSSVAGSFTVQVRTARLNGSGVQPPPPVRGRLLIAGPLLGSFTGTHDGRNGFLRATIPAELALLCQHFTAQAVVTGGGIALSSALEGTVGTF